MHPDPESSQYQWQSSVVHDVTPSCSSSKGTASSPPLPLCSTIDMSRSGLNSVEQEQKQAASSSSALTHLFRRVSNAVHGNTTSPATRERQQYSEEQDSHNEKPEQQQQQPSSPVSTAVGEDENGINTNGNSPDQFYLNGSDTPVNHQEDSHYRHKVHQHRSAKSCLIAIFMITVGTSLALAFILIGIGKALSNSKANNSAAISTATTSTTMAIPTSSIATIATVHSRGFTLLPSTS
ncbi:hypothetical protein BDC45DRAFT_275930 [Circinella umbellata]|nr:hypothetical protein BDC45DRAFT_275930 [Circinella umbellata]